MIRKSILIEEAHNKYINENSINFSKWVRNELDKAMEAKNEDWLFIPKR